MSKVLYRFEWDCGRMGDLDGLFIWEELKEEDYVGKYVYFGEVLGKHSEIYGNLEKDDIVEVSRNPILIEELEKAFGDEESVLCGYNPFDYVEDEDDGDEDWEEGE